MKNSSICLVIFAITLLLACTLHTVEGDDKINWRDSVPVQEFLKNRPYARRMTEGPLGGILDIIIDILLILIDIILGGAISPLKAEMSAMKEQMNQMGALLGGK